VTRLQTPLFRHASGLQIQLIGFIQELHCPWQIKVDSTSTTRLSVWSHASRALTAAGVGLEGGSGLHQLLHASAEKSSQAKRRKNERNAYFS